jgi:hemoglobin
MPPPTVSRTSLPPEEPLIHPDVDRAFIGRLVRTFYGRVRGNERLGPIFAGVIGEDWEPHLEKMTEFWCSVILKTRSYEGRPVPAHLKLKMVREEDFTIWLSLFRETADELCPPGAAEIFIERAERIAESLKLAMFFRLPQSAPA